MNVALVSACALLCVAAPARADSAADIAPAWRTDRRARAPEEPSVDRQPRYAQFATGLALGVSSWVASVVLAFTPVARSLQLGEVRHDYGDAVGIDVTGRIAIPIPAIGPFIAAGYTDNASGRAVLVADGLLQLGAMALTIAGAIGTPRAAPPPVAVMPILSGSAAGVGVTGAF